MAAAEGNVQKSRLFHPPKPKGAKTPFSTGKAAAILMRGAYSQYVTANAAESGKSVNPKGRHKGENAAGGFFQHSLQRDSTLPDQLVLHHRKHLLIIRPP